MEQCESNVPGCSMTEQEIEQQLSYCLRILEADPKEALRVGLLLLEQTRGQTVVRLYTTALVICGESAYRLEEKDYIRYYHEAETLWSRVETSIDRAKLLNELARVRKRHGDYSNALYFLIEGRSMLEGVDDPLALKYLSQTFDIIGNLLNEVGEYEQSIRYLLRGYELRTEHGLLEGQLNSLINIGNVYGEMKDYGTALEYYEKALKLGRDLDHTEAMAFAHNHIGTVHVSTGEDEKGLEYLLRALELFPSEQWEVCYTLNSIGVAYEHLGQYECAMEYQERALTIAENNQNARMRSCILGGISRIHRQHGDWETALDTIAQGLKICQDAGLRVEELELHEQIADLYTQRGRLSEALEHYRNHATLREEIFSVERIRAVAATELRYSLLNTERERELMRLRAEKAEQDAAYRARELNTIALQLTQRNEALKALHEVALPYSRDGRGQTKDLAARIIENIESVSGAQEGWALFEEQFEGVYREFIGKLREMGPKLTPTEIKICVLIKMNLSTKQIADLLFTSVLTVKTHRTHIRRKLGLEGEENLGSMLLSL